MQFLLVWAALFWCTRLLAQVVEARDARAVGDAQVRSLHRRIEELNGQIAVKEENMRAFKEARSLRRADKAPGSEVLAELSFQLDAAKCARAQKARELELAQTTLADQARRLDLMRGELAQTARELRLAQATVSEQARRINHMRGELAQRTATTQQALAQQVFDTLLRGESFEETINNTASFFLPLSERTHSAEKKERRVWACIHPDNHRMHAEFCTVLSQLVFEQKK